MRVMAFFQLNFLQNSCVQGRMGTKQGHLCHIDTFLVHLSVMFWFLLLTLLNNLAEGSHLLMSY